MVIQTTTPRVPEREALSGSARPGRGSRARTARSRRRPTRLWLFVLPAVAFYVFVVVVPSIRGAQLAFTDWDGLSQGMHYVGLDNLRRLFADPTARETLGNTILLAIGITVIQNVVGLALALALHTKIKTRGVLRVFLFAPAVMTPIAAGFLWRNLLAPEGAVNTALSAIGLGGLRQDWLGNPHIALWTIVGVVVWQFAGYSMVIFLAGLEGIPAEINEASMLDGARAWSRFWYIVRPMLAPAITVNLMLSMIGGLKLFDQIEAMTGGGPGHASESMSTLLYKTAFTSGQFGYATAIALVFAVLVAVVSAVQYGGLARQGR